MVKFTQRISKRVGSYDHREHAVIVFCCGALFENTMMSYASSGRRSDDEGIHVAPHIFAGLCVGRYGHVKARRTSHNK